MTELDEAVERISEDIGALSGNAVVGVADIQLILSALRQYRSAEWKAMEEAAESLAARLDDRSVSAMIRAAIPAGRKMILLPCPRVECAEIKAERDTLGRALTKAVEP